ncbi:MAG TPA: hypothetical protein VEA69_19005 [Tepidisphaeraceae bacterium]|nr:hypothetical protein [Tepidisphaeraceae bacterium]
MTTIQLSLTDDARRFLEEQAAREGLSDSTAYVEQLIAREQRLSEDERVERALIIGIESGPSVDADDAFWHRKAASLTERARAALRDRG